MPSSSEADFLVLHSLRLKGFAEVDVVAAAAEVEADDARKYLESFEDEGWVKHRAGAVSGWTLTGEGRKEGERRAAAELDQTGLRSEVASAYQQFLAHNADLLQLCTDWQVRETDGGPAINDHEDAEYDEAVVSRLAAIDAAIQPVAGRLAGLLDRFASYGPRLSGAASLVAEGHHDWFTKPTIDSYHTVWFELHENLLATLGIERGKETS